MTTDATPTATWVRYVAGFTTSAPFTLPAWQDPNVLFKPQTYMQIPDGTAVPNGSPCDGKTFGPVPDPVLSAAQLLTFASNTQDEVLGGVFGFDVAAAGRPAHVVTTRLDAKGQFAMVKVQGWLTLNASNPTAAMPYSNVDFTYTTLTVAEADSLVEQAAAKDIQSYAILNQVAAGVAASPPTVTTAKQVLDAFAALAPVA